MKGLIKGLVLALILLTLSSSSLDVMHKYYTSITEIEYVKDKASLQIITRIFLDDLEKTLSDQTGKKIVFQSEDETDENLKLLQDYLSKNLIITVDGKTVSLDFLGKRHDNNQLFAYMEVDDVKTIHNLEIKNTVLMKSFKEQQNIVHTKINDTNASTVLTVDQDNLILNYNPDKKP